MSLIRVVKRKLGLIASEKMQTDATIRAEKTVKSLERLEDSQQGLKSVLREAGGDTGFFLGDALRVERREHERRENRTHR